MAPDMDPLVDLRSLETVSEYDGHLMCPICHCPFVHPIQLKCDHIFCQACLKAHQGEPPLDNFPCPTCRAPTNSIFRNAPRLIVVMCDDILVKCPFSSEGCEETMQRGYVQTHVDKYCHYRLVQCLDVTCEQMMRVKDIPSNSHCVHELWECERCGELVMELELEKHKRDLCPKAEVTCSDCGIAFSRSELEAHAEDCLMSACAASVYGCPVRLRKSEIEQHKASCPLVTLGPYLEAQSTRISLMEITIRQLQQRNEVLEDGIANIRSSLQISRPPSGVQGATNSSELATEETPPGSVTEFQTESTSLPESSTANNTNTTTYLLSLQESLREEVTQLASALSDLDVRANLSMMNESLRIREDMAHISAGLNTVRMQVHMLINSRLQQGQQRSMSAHPTATGNGGGVGGLDGPGPSNSSGQGRIGTEFPGRPRRLSDSREGTKL
ncbi:hypothetical protein PRK78_002883 [Emydomyces testavorans]|uniref:Uncharacterized protein n=1 Tax=Emydomyces testavorans TaxID=2070801 RepID=A0AAF0II90_9EURO|nr:hypothetical protein PRK78_002883 [Emydomyces testavorans]